MEEKDTCIWEKSYSGLFSLSSAWNDVRSRGLKTHLSQSCWHKHIPLKISIFLWKLIYNALPTDYAIKRKGIHVVSKCL